MSSPPLYTTTLSLPYSPHSPLNTLDIHTPHPTNPPSTPSYNILYIHGGAFRDPLATSTSLLPSLPALFAPGHHIAAVASVNYRLSPHPEHANGKEREEGRDVRWPTHIEDVRQGIAWLKRHGAGLGWGTGREWIVAGHSVGGTMALMLGMHREGGDGGWGREANGAMEGLRAVVSLQGIFSFGLCRDRHLGSREVYDSFTTGAFGPESEGGWEKGDLIQCGRGVGEGVDVVVLGHSRGDELVEWEQAVGMGEVLGREGREGVGVVVEVEGGHQEVISGGEGLGRCVVVAVAMLVERSKGGRGGMIGKRAEGEAGLQVLQA